MPRGVDTDEELESLAETTGVKKSPDVEEGWKRV